MKTTITPKPKRSETVKVNGAELYYEVHGEGEPLFMLHGYTQSSIVWKEYIDEYSKDFEVYLVDARGHGKSSAFKERLSVRESAKDILALIKYLRIEKIKGIGFSFGADLLLQISSMNPDILESMIIVGANGDWDARDYPEMLDTFNYDNIDDFRFIYDFHSGGDEQVKAIVEQLANYKIKMSENELANIKAKTLLLVGDSDPQISVESVVRLNEKLSNSYLWIVPNTVHYAHDGDNKSEFLRISKAFFSGNWKG